MVAISEITGRRLGVELLVAMGAEEEAARVVSDHLVDANLAGHDSHGLVRLPQYHQQVLAGQIRLGTAPTLVRETATTAVVDGGWTWGPFVATFATDLAIERAKAHGISLVGLRNCAHVGRVGVYPLRAAEQGLIGHAWCNGVGAARVAPWGGMEARLATNPLAVAIPRGERPIVVDITTSAVAEGKVRVARNAGKPVPEGWILNSKGEPTTAPADLYEGGTIVPLGGPLGHKGFALSLVVDIFGGILTGAGCGLMEGVAGNGNGMMIVAIDPAAMLDPEEFRRKVDDYVAYVRGTPKRPGVEEILLPGEPEERTAAERRRTGIPIDDGTWKQLCELAARLGVEL